MELWDIYDKNKVRTGRTMERNHFNLADDEYHPGWWEVSGGAAQAGEESEDAVRREVLEETGLDVRNATSGGYMFSYKRENPGEGDNYFVDIYRYVMDIDEKDIHLQEIETDGFKFATAEEIKELADQGIFLHYDSICKVFS